MIIRFPQNDFVLDTLNVPADFEDKIKDAFAKFTEGTSREYTFVDKLYFLDRLRFYINGCRDADQIVEDEILEYTRFEIQEGRIPDTDDIKNLAFIINCCELGDRDFYRTFEPNRHQNEATQAVILRIIQLVVNWEPGDSHDD